MVVGLSGSPQVVQTGAAVAYTFFVMPHDPRETTPILRVRSPLPPGLLECCIQCGCIAPFVLMAAQDDARLSVDLPLH